MSGAQNHTLAGADPEQRLRRVALQQPLLLVAIATLTGIVLSSVLHGRGIDAAGPVWTAVWLVLGALGLTAILFGRDLVPTVAAVIVFCPLGAWLHCSAEVSYRSATILRYAGEQAQATIVEGIVCRGAVLRRHPLADQPGRRGQSPWQTQIEIQLQQLRLGRRFRPVTGRVLVVVDQRQDRLKPGDAVRVYGTMRRFSAPTNPGEPDLRSAYRLRRLHARIDVDSGEQVVLLGHRSTRLGWLNRAVASIAGGGRDLLLTHTSDSAGPLAVALVIGQRELVDNELRDLLLVTGTVHLLSVSGLHLGIIVVLAGWSAAALRIPPIGKISWILVICFLYTAITGARPPVMRASVLVATFMFAIWMRRPSQPINTLALAALILMFWNPQLVFGIGVQLSFLAVATLVICGGRGGSNSPVAEHALRREARLQRLLEGARSKPIRYLRYGRHFLWQLTWLSGCVTALSIPLVWQQFHVVSPISTVANVVLGPLLFLSLAAGVATVVLGFVYDPLAIVPGWICSGSVHIMRWLIETAASIPGGHFWLPSPPSWWVAAFYIVIAATLWLRPSKKASRIRQAWIGVWICIAWMLATSKPSLQPGDFEATFVDVGHGTSVVLRFSQDDVWLYDCGRLGNNTGSSRDIDVTLWSLGITRLQGVFLSHADADHFNALPGLLRRFSVRQVITPPGMLNEPEPALAMIRQTIRMRGLSVRELASGMSGTIGGHRVQVLHPPRPRSEGSDNANSLVLRIDCGGTSLLLPGDLEPPGTGRLIHAERPPAGGILMAPHHGSLRMDAASVLQWSRPRETIVSGGQRAQHPEVHEMLAATGSGVHVTSKVGAIRVRIDRQGKVDVRSWRSAPWQ